MRVVGLKTYMKKYKSAIENISEELKFVVKRYGDPIDIEKLRSDFVTDISPYVHNKSLLEETAKIGTHLWEYAFFLKIKQNKEYKTFFDRLYSCFQDAQLKAPNDFIESYSHFWDDKHKAIRDYSDHFHLERDKDFESKDLLSIKIAFQEIGVALEGCIQPFARHFLCLQMLSKPKPFIGFGKVDQMTFGNIINDLAQINDFKPIYKPAPWFLSIGQWRNIAQHSKFNYDDIKQCIICEYGTPPNLKEIHLSFDDLHMLCVAVNDIFCIHKVADSIFSLGITDKLAGLSASTSVTPDTVAGAISEILISHSITITNFIWEDDPWILETVDPHNRPQDELESIFNEVARFRPFTNDCRIKFKIKLGETDQTVNGYI
jgi:hypothetical protein